MFSDLLNPWIDVSNDSIFTRAMNLPVVNIIAQEGEYIVALASPGLTRQDFQIAIDGNMLIIKSEKEDKEGRKAINNSNEYNYSSFSRSFTLPEDVIHHKIEIHYEQGILKVFLPRNQKAKKSRQSKFPLIKPQG